MSVYNINGEEIGASSGISPEIKSSLLDCFERVAWTVGDSQDYYDALEAALNNEPASVYPKIRAIFTPGVRTVYTKDNLDTLKLNLTVTYYEDENDSGTILADSAYTLSGSLSVGSNTITATYNNLISTFTVTAKTPKYRYQMSLGELTLHTGMPSTATAGGQMIPWIESSNANRRSVSCDEGARLYGSSTAGQFLEGVFVVPVPGDTTSVTVTITPSSMYTALNFLRLEKQLNGNIDVRYIGTEKGWTAGTSSHTCSEHADKLRIIIINIKYNSAGTSFPSNPTDLIIQFS